jgi:UTP--glucose-1-phosphate uridylyltransferase
VDKPLIQYAVEEAVAAGIERVVFVVAEGKEAITEHFGHLSRVEAFARESGDRELLERVQQPSRLARYEYVLQDRPLGIAHAVACAREFVEGEAFALMFPDDLILGDESCTAQMVAAYAGEGSLIAVQEVAREEVSSYGIVETAGPGNPAPLRGMVEKPSVEAAPSTTGIVGRYILGATIFEHIGRIQPGKNGELQLTDALLSQLQAGEPVQSYHFRGTRHDTGRPLGLLTASVAAGLERPELGPALTERLRDLLNRGEHS